MGRIFSWIIHGLSHTLWKNEMKNLPKHQPVIMFKTNITRKNERHGIKKKHCFFFGRASSVHSGRVHGLEGEKKKLRRFFQWAWWFQFQPKDMQMAPSIAIT